ncbi:MAG: DUF1573 domain-containing protein [Tannerella sp.]|jgi:hypothetical protein|nr:DUF1573 domain-containing protein [Tannerella sp.]
MVKKNAVFHCCLTGFFFLTLSLCAQHKTEIAAGQNTPGYRNIQEARAAVHDGIALNEGKSPLAEQEEAKKGPVFTVNEAVHDFGLIHEEDIEVVHEFKVTNTGDEPLIIEQVQTSCGCAEPIWTREPIEPGKEGEVVIIYSTEKRPGPFKKNITVYTNEKKYRQRLTIMGDVIPKSSKLLTSFHDTIGTIQMERKDFAFYTVRPKEISKQEIWIQNYSSEEVTLTLENIPAYLTIEVPEKLGPDETQRLKMTVDGNKLDEKGHYLNYFTWNAVSASGNNVKTDVPVTVNFVDDFSTLSQAERSEGAQMKLSATLLDFGKVKKTGFLGIGSKPASQALIITNEGKYPLILHTVSVDDPQVDFDTLKNTVIQPGKSMNMEILIRPKKLKGTLETELYIVCNDAKGPVRQVKITARK